MKKARSDFYPQVLESIEAPLLVIDPGYRVLFMNRAASSLFCSADSETDEPLLCHRATHGRDQPCSAHGESCPLQNVLTTGRSVRVVHNHTDADGASHYVEIIASPLRDEAGEITAVVEVLHDLDGLTFLRKLEDSEARYRQVMEAAPDAMIIAGADGVIVDCNRAVSTTFGYTPEELRGQSVTLLMPARLRQQHEAAMRQAAQTGRCYLAGATVETTGRHKSNGEFFVELSIASWEQNQRRFFSAVARDISLRKALEQALADERQQVESSRNELAGRNRELQILVQQLAHAKQEWEKGMDGLEEMVLLVDNQSRIIRCNRAFADFIEKSYTQVLGSQWTHLLLEHGLEKASFYAQGREYFHKKSGKWLYLNINPIHTGDAATDGFVVAIHDLTAVKKIGEELERKNHEIEENRNKLQKALDKISSLIKKVAQEGRFDIYFDNPTQSPCWKTMRCRKGGCPCYGQEPMRCWQKAGTFCKGEVQGEFAQKYGNCLSCPHYQQVMDDPIAQIGEQFNNMMFILAGKNQELENAYNDLKQAQAQLLQREKMASIGQLAAGVAHEINNPIGFVNSNLGSMVKYLDRLVEFLGLQSECIVGRGQAEEMQAMAEARRRLKIDAILADTPDLLRESQEGIERVKKIVMDLKGFSRIDQAERQYADIHACLETTIGIAWNELKYKTAIIREYGDLPLVECFPQQLNQVFMNLLVNAAHAIDKQGEITIRTWQDKDSVFVSVRDTGCGIPAAHLTRIFEPFFTTKEVGKGTGLGLSIVYDIVTKNHGGAITVESEVGKGTVFTVRLPVETRKEEGGIQESVRIQNSEFRSQK